MSNAAAPGAGEPQEPLLRRAARGEPEAVDRWLREERTPVYRLCLGFLAEPAAAEDAAQDAMLHLLDRLELYDPGRPYAAWRNALVLNLCRDRTRRGAQHDALRRSARERGGGGDARARGARARGADAARARGLRAARPRGPRHGGGRGRHGRDGEQPAQPAPSLAADGALEGAPRPETLGGGPR